MQGRLALRLTELSNKESWLNAKSLQLLAMAKVNCYGNGRCPTVRTWLARTLEGGRRSEPCCIQLTTWRGSARTHRTVSPPSPLRRDDRLSSPFPASELNGLQPPSRKASPRAEHRVKKVQCLRRV